jgi:hypothetical protein
MRQTGPKAGPAVWMEPKSINEKEAEQQQTYATACHAERGASGTT